MTSVLVSLDCLLLLLDVVTIDKTGENFRLIFDTKGRFTVHRITPEEASVSHLPCSLCSGHVGAVIILQGLISDLCDNAK